MSTDDEFFIGWSPKQPPSYKKTVRLFVFFCFIIVLLTGSTLAFFQHNIGLSAFEWGNIRAFSGVLQKAPYPHLLVERPNSDTHSVYPLVAPLKYGLSPELCAPLDGKTTDLKGTLIYRGGATMIEVIPDTIALMNDSTNPPSVPGPMPLGEFSFSGEIVDSKCYYGVMNPGSTKSHRPCAILCIKGGIPPVFIVDGPDNSKLYLMLVGEDGTAINEEVLQLVAKPVRVTGQVISQGDLLVLKTDPATIEIARR